ncbi:hypothetical protein TNCV_491121 [Trichonephila clavipes]|nr:hypothetical protein TNCV_491121 [Trichonephila clavipes]
MSAKKIRSLVGMRLLGRKSAHAENEGVNELLRHHSSCSVIVGCPAAKRQEKSHTCSLSRSGQSIRYPHSLRAVRHMVHCRPCRNCRPIAPLKDAHMEEESRSNNGSR